MAKTWAEGVDERLAAIENLLAVALAGSWTVTALNDQADGKEKLANERTVAIPMPNLLPAEVLRHEVRILREAASLGLHTDEDLAE